MMSEKNVTNMTTEFFNDSGGPLTTLTAEDIIVAAKINNIIYYSILIPVALCGNIFTISAVIMVLRIKKSIPNLFIGVLACSDLLSILTCHLIALISMTQGSYAGNAHWCNFQSMMSYSYFKLGFLTKVTISIDRFIALKFPLRYRSLVTLKRAYAHIIVLITFSYGTSGATLIFDPHYITKLDTWDMCRNDWTIYTDYKLSIAVIEGGFFIIGCIVFFISNITVIRVMYKLNHTKKKLMSVHQLAHKPIAAVSVLVSPVQINIGSLMSEQNNNFAADATSLCRRGSKGAKRVDSFTDLKTLDKTLPSPVLKKLSTASLPSSMSSPFKNGTTKQKNGKNKTQRVENRQQKELKFAKLVMAIVTVFVILWLPNMALIYWSFAEQKVPPSIVEDIAIKLVFANACLNPILYGVFNANFRKAYIYYLQMMAFYITCKLGKKPSGEGLPWAKKKSPYTNFESTAIRGSPANRSPTASTRVSALAAPAQKNNLHPSENNGVR